MVKTFIQTIDWHHALRLLRKSLASLLIFSLLASDIVKAMEDEGSKYIAPLLKAGDQDSEEEETSRPNLELNGDLNIQFPPSEHNNPQRRRASSLSTLAVVIKEEQSPHTPSVADLSPRAYSADSLPRPPLLDDKRNPQISLPQPRISPVPERREEIIIQPIQPLPRNPSLSSQPSALSVPILDPLDPRSQNGPLFTMTEHFVQLESPLHLVSTMVSSPLPMEDDLLQNPKKPSSLPQPVETDSDSDEFDDGNSLIIVFDSSVENQSAAKRRDKRVAAQQQLGTPKKATERTRLLSINGEDFDEYMAREFVELGNIGPNSTEALSLPPETSSWWQKFRSWKSGRTWLPQKTTYTLESPETRWLHAFRHQDRGNSEDKEIIGGDRRPSSHVEGTSSDDSGDDQLESSDSSGHGSPQNTKTAVLFNDLTDPLAPHSHSDRDSEDDSLGSSPQSTQPSDLDLLFEPVSRSDKPSLFPAEKVVDGQKIVLLSHQASRSSIVDDLEAGGSSTWATFKSKLGKFFGELPPKAKAQLKRFQDRFIDEKWSAAGIVGGVIGTTIAILFSIAMLPVYADGLWYVEETSGWQWLYNMYNGANTEWILAGYLFISLMPDATPRNIQSWQMALSDWNEKWRHKGRNSLLLGACFLPSLIEPFYLLQVEENNIIVTGDHGLNQFTIAAAVLAPPLFLDSYASNIRSAASGLESLKAGYADFKSFMSKCFFHQARQSLPSSEVNRQALGKSLDKASKYFEQAPDEHITDIYANLLQIQQSDAPEEAHKALLSISYLVSLGEEVIEGQKAKKSYYKLLADILNWGSLVGGSVARGVILYFIFSTILGYFMPDGWAEVLGVVGAALAYAPRTLLEYKGMDGFFNHYLREETPTGHSSYGKVRTMVKVGTLWQGLFFSLPLAVLTLQTNQTLLNGSPWFLLSAVPFVFTEVAAQTTSFHTTYNLRTTSALITLHNKGTRKCQGKDLSISYKRDLLVQLALQAQKDIKEWSSDLIDTLRMSVNLPQNLERDPI